MLPSTEQEVELYEHYMQLYHIHELTVQVPSVPGTNIHPLNYINLRFTYMFILQNANLHFDCNYEKMYLIS